MARRATMTLVAPERCSVCHDVGWLRVFVGPEAWRTDVVRCACMQAEDTRRRWERARRASDLSPQLYSCTFEHYDGRHNGEAAAAVTQWAQAAGAATSPSVSEDMAQGLYGQRSQSETAPWLVLWGPPGTGKTHLLAAAFNALTDGGGMAVYTIVPMLLDHIREGYEHGDYGERFWAVRRAPVLLLDDLGAEMRTVWSDQALFMLLDHRYTHGLPTLVASNLAPWDLEPRIASRLQDGRMSSVWLMTGPDYRGSGLRGVERVGAAVEAVGETVSRDRA